MPRRSTSSTSSRRTGSSGRVAALLIGLASVGLAQDTNAQPVKGVISGKILNSITGEPVRKAHVALFELGSGTPHRRKSPGGGGALTDAEGRFEFSSLPPGTYGLAAAHDGFSTRQAHGQPALLRVALAQDEQKDDLVIRLKPLSAISGRILDEDGDPIRSIEIQAMAYEYTSSGRKLAGRFNATTNDLGEYRMYDMEPGRYVLKASPMAEMGNDPDSSFASAYYPGTPDAAAAAPVDLAAGQQSSGIDLTLHRTRVANIRGRVLNPGGNPMVGLFSAREGGGSSSMNTQLESADGKFELRGVSPGPYVLNAHGTINGQQYGAQLPIQVGASDLEGIELRLQPPVSIAGRLRIEGKTTVKPAAMRIELNSDSGSSATLAGGDIKEDGSFALESVEPGVYEITVHAPGDLYVKGERWGDRDVAQSGLDLTQGASGVLTIVMSANGGKLAGAVQNGDAGPAIDAWVALVPAAMPASKALFKLVSQRDRPLRNAIDLARRL